MNSMARNLYGKVIFVYSMGPKPRSTFGYPRAPFVLASGFIIPKLLKMRKHSEPTASLLALFTVCNCPDVYRIASMHVTA